MRTIFLIIVVVFYTISCKLVMADSLNIPSATIPSGYDRITTSNGTTCESTIASDMYIQTGMVGLNVGENSFDDAKYKPYNHARQNRDKVGVYAQLVIPIGSKRERINCNRLYELEIRHLKEQLMKLKLETMSENIWDE